ncbi:MAG: hypothetical protein WBF42_13525 [Terracidiphilus sp.]
MRQDVYRVAYDEAYAELSDIRGRFEQLLMRKSRLEGVIAVLAPLVQAAALANSGMASGEQVATPASNPAEPPAYTFNQVPNPLPGLEETGGDPFNRRIRNALRTKPLGTEQQGLQTAV